MTTNKDAEGTVLQNITKLLEVAEELADRVVQESGGKLLEEDYWEDTVDMARKLLRMLRGQE